MSNLDATGKEIDFNILYGYSQSSSGVSTIRIGKPIKVANNKLTLEIVYSKSCLYDYDATECDSPTRSVSVKFCHCFPVTDFVK